MKKLLGAAFVFAVCISMISVSANAQRPWWCSQNRAMNCTETVICATPQLSQLDVEMSSLYHTLQSYSGRRDARRLLQSQRGWLRARNSCGCNANCLVGYYSRRIGLFRAILY